MALTSPTGDPFAGQPAAPFNPQQMMQMMQVMQMMQMMQPGAGVDPSAQPFVAPQSQDAALDAGLEAEFVRPSTLGTLIREQDPLPFQPVLDRLCLKPDGTPLGGLPKGCTIAFAGPPGTGKTRSCLEGLLRVAATGVPCLFVVAEEGFLDEGDSGRDPLVSRMAKIGCEVLAMGQQELKDKVLTNVWVMQAQYHKGQSWDDFIHRYRYVVEHHKIKVVVIDSLNMLDPAKTRTADHLSALKTYNHEHGVTCVTIGQIRDTGMPVGGEALMHTADTVFLLEQMSMSSKEMGATWGASYRDIITVLRAVKSVTTKVFPYPVRVCQDGDAGTLAVHPQHPEMYALPG